MQSITRTHNAYHLGDNLVHLNFLRKVAIANPERQFVHYAQWQYIRQLREVIEDVPNIKLEDYGYLLPSDSINAWRGTKQFWYNHPDRNDFVKFHLEAWFPYLADHMEVGNPMGRDPEQMLFDYPAIKNASRAMSSVSCDVLIINSPPASGQFQGYNEQALTDIACGIKEKGFSVVASGTGKPQPFYSATEIGHLSLHCHTILMVSTGPSWPTFNIWNQDTVKNRIILLDSERIYLSPHTMHCTRIEEADEVLKQCGLL